MRVTARGWGMLAAGAAIGLLAAAMSSPVAARIAALLLALPLSAVGWALISRARDGRRRIERTLSPPTWQVGRPGTVALHITGRRLAPWSSLRERVPQTLGRTPGGPRSYDVLPTRRGRFTLGPGVLRRADPFALVRWAQDVPPETSVLVWPRVEPVDAEMIAGALDATAPYPHGTPQRTLEDLTVREYRRGDDLHRVHWRSTARHGELMVRHDEPTTTDTIDLLLLLHRDDALGEWAVAAAASVAQALTSAGSAVRVATVASGEVVVEDCASLADVLDWLAIAEVADDTLALEVTRRVARSDATGLVAVLDRSDGRAVDVLAPLGADRAAGALVTGAVAEDAAERLRVAGWSATGTPGPVAIADAWSALAPDGMVSR